MPAVRQRATFAEDRTLGGLYRLLGLSGMHFYAANYAQRRRRPGQKGAGRRSGHRPRSDAARRPLRSLSAARRADQAAESEKGRKETGSREAKARQHSEGHFT